MLFEYGVVAVVADGLKIQVDVPEHGREARGVAASAELLTPHTQLRLVIQTAIWLRFGRSSLVRMCCTWFCAVRSDR